LSGDYRVERERDACSYARASTMRDSKPMRRVGTLILVALGCEGGTTAGTGSTGSGATRSAASGSATRVASAVAGDAGLATMPLTISSKGLSTLGRYEWWKHDDQETLALLRQRIALPDVTVSIVTLEVDREGYVKHTARYWSIKRGDKEIIQVFRDEGGAPEGPRPVKVVVLSADVPTDDGIKVGDKASTVFARHPDVRCRILVDATIALTITSYRACAGFPGGELVYVLSERGKKFAVGPVEHAAVANLEIIALVQQAYD